MVKCFQINVGKREAATDELNLRVSKGEADIIFIQEPRTMKNNKVRGPFGGTNFHSSTHLSKPIRASIWVRSDVVKQSNCFLLEQFSNRDQTSVLLEYKNLSGSKRKLMLCSVYLPSLDDNYCPINKPISNTLESLVSHCKSLHIELVISGDFNCHNKIWGDLKDDSRGNRVLDYLN